MVATNLKAETKALIDRRAGLESEMNALIETLCRPGGPGISGTLTDSEGFPRSDFDIPTVLAQRKKLSELRNDHKNITEKIEKHIELLHSSKLHHHKAPSKDQGPSVSASPSSSSSQNIPPIPRIAFATIDEIAEDSPASEDGLQLGDEIVKFGSVEIGERLQERLVSESQLNIGNGIPVIIMRQGSTMELTLTPRNWRGRGLLGCHFNFL